MRNIHQDQCCCWQSIFTEQQPVFITYDVYYRLQPEDDQQTWCLEI